MKSSWIVFAVFWVIAGAVTNGYAVGAQQSFADDKPGQEAQSSVSSAKFPKSAEPSVATQSVLATAVPTPAQPAAVKPRASYMLVELSHGLKAKKLKVGDKVKAEVSQDVVSKGKIIIPVETKLIGHVTEVSARGSGHPESRLGIVFDRILLNHHQEINFEGVVQAVSQPVMRRSLVDEPSQMLPPSMMGVGSRGSVPTGRGTSGANTAAMAQTGSGGSASLSAVTATAPVVVKNSPSPRNESTAATLETDSSGKPLSIGMPQGVTGIKGLSLSAVPSSSTPGPVIVSNTENVKLDSGTQILLHVLKVEVPATVKPAK
jgi:hypothetical protein